MTAPSTAKAPVAPPTSVLKLGLPLMLAMGGHAFFNLVDLAMVGAYYEDGVQVEQTIAGMTIASLLTTAPIVFMTGVSNGTVPVLARAFGAGKILRANLFGRQAILVSILLSVLLGVIPGLFAEQIATLFRAEPGLELQVASDYLSINCYWMFTAFVLTQLTSNMRAIGMGLWPMTLLLLSNFGNVIGNWLLIYGNWGFPELGPAQGAAWATVGARGVSMVLAVFVLARAHPAIRISLGGWRPRLRFIWVVVSSGLPVALQWTLRLSSVICILFVISQFGQAAKAAFGIGSRLETLALFAALGWGGACAPLLGMCVARDDFAGARKVTRQAAVYCVITMAIAGAAYAAFPAAVIRVFSLSVEEQDLASTIAHGTDFLRISVLSYPAVALAVVWSHALNGAGSVKTPLLIDAAGLLLLQVPLAFVLASTSLEVEGAWWALVISHYVIALVYFLVFRAGAWERKRLR